MYMFITMCITMVMYLSVSMSGYIFASVCIQVHQHTDMRIRITYNNI